MNNFLCEVTQLCCKTMLRLVSLGLVEFHYYWVCNLLPCLWLLTLGICYPVVLGFSASCLNCLVSLRWTISSCSAMSHTWLFLGCYEWNSEGFVHAFVCSLQFFVIAYMILYLEINKPDNIILLLCQYSFMSVVDALTLKILCLNLWIWWFNAYSNCAMMHGVWSQRCP